jgi:hypothetical protein
VHDTEKLLFSNSDFNGEAEIENSMKRSTQFEVHFTHSSEFSAL